MKADKQESVKEAEEEEETQLTKKGHLPSPDRKSVV